MFASTSYMYVPLQKVKGLRLGKSNLLRAKHSPRFRGSTEGINQVSSENMFHNLIMMIVMVCSEIS